MRDLLKEVILPEKYMKAIYRHTMLNHKLKDHWKPAHTQAFLRLKKILMSEPVLRGPQWDGMHFIVTSDSCQDRFGAILAQQFTTTLPNGCEVPKLHPLEFASKQTS